MSKGMHVTIPVPYELDHELDLRGSRYANRSEDDIFLISCPICASAEVLGISPAFNPGVEYLGVWYCKVCETLWSYTLAHCPDCGAWLEGYNEPKYYCPRCDYYWDAELINRINWKGF